MTSRRLPLILLLVAAVFLVPSAVHFYTDWLWFGEVGYQHVLLRAPDHASRTLWLSVFVVGVRVALRQPAARVPRADAARDRHGHAGRPARHRRRPGAPAADRDARRGRAGALAARVYRAASHWETWLRLLERDAVRQGRSGARATTSASTCSSCRSCSWLHVAGAPAARARRRSASSLIYVGAGPHAASASQRGIQLRPPALAHLVGARRAAGCSRSPSAPGWRSPSC